MRKIPAGLHPSPSCFKRKSGGEIEWCSPVPQARPLRPIVMGIGLSTSCHDESGPSLSSNCSLPTWSISFVACTRITCRQPLGKSAVNLRGIGLGRVGRSIHQPTPAARIIANRVSERLIEREKAMELEDIPIWTSDTKNPEDFSSGFFVNVELVLVPAVAVARAVEICVTGPAIWIPAVRFIVVIQTLAAALVVIGGIVFQNLNFHPFRGA